MGFGKEGRGAIIREIGSIALSTLGSNVAIKDATPIVLQEDFRIKRSDIYVTLDGATEGEMPIIFGMCNGELSVAEIGECIGAEGPVDRNDRLNVEKAERGVWPILQLGAAAAGGVLIPNDGKVVEFKPGGGKGWTFSDSEGWNFFAYNNSGGPLTTGGVIRYIVTHYGVWVT